MKLQGKVALITGGGTGVGRATALALARQGCSVAVNFSRSKEDAQRTVAEIRELGASAIAYQADVAEDPQCKEMVEAAVKELGRLDILVNSAGTTSFIPHSELDRVTDADWDRILGVNVKGAFFCARAAAKPMREAGSGVIVNIASVAGIGAIGSSIPYAASKAALINMTISLARVLGPTIRVNAVAPGFITGRWLEKGLGPSYGFVKKSVEDRVPLRRVCDPEDVAEVVMSLISGSKMVTGQTIVVDGGMLIGGSAL